MKRILHIRRIPPTGFDGTDNYCQRLYQYLANDNECKVLPIPNIPEEKSIFNYRYDRNVLRTYIEQADIIHVNGYTAWGTRQALKMAKQMGKKVVYTAHWHPFCKLHRPIFGRLFFEIFLKAYVKRYPDVITTINNEDTTYFRHLHNNVIQIPHWNADAAKPDSNIQRLPNKIVFVGRINDPVKGFFHILSLPENVYDIHCVGKGEINTTRKDITHHINIPQEELNRLYAEASLVVIPSQYEAFSYAALEALAQGTPVVMSEFVRIADHLNQIDGYSVFHYGDLEEFQEKVKTTIGKKVDVDYIASTFSANRIISIYKQIYLSL